MQNGTAVKSDSRLDLMKFSAFFEYFSSKPQMLFQATEFYWNELHLSNKFPLH